MKDYCIIDLETPYGLWFDKVSNPFVEENNVIKCGIIYSDKLEVEFDYEHSYETTVRYSGIFNSASDDCNWYYWSYLYSSIRLGVSVTSGDSAIPSDIFDYTYIVAHNSHFELLYILKYYFYEFLDWVNRGGRLVCTQFNHYKLSHQLIKGADLALDTLAPKYGGYHKVDLVKDLWKLGVKTEEINPDLLDYYLKYDVFNTWILFTNQIAHIQSSGQLNYYEHHWTFMMFTGLMEYFGKYIDRKKYKELGIKVKKEVQTLEYKLKERISDLYGPTVAMTVNLGSPMHLSALIYGGPYKATMGSLCYVKDAPETIDNIYRYKTGDKKGHIKTVRRPIEIELDGLGVDMEHVPQSKNRGIWKTGHLIIKKFEEYPLVAAILEYRKKATLLKNSLADMSNMSKSIHPNSLIRSSFGHYSTETGRTNSVHPNMQNQPKGSDLRSFYCSRFEHGRFVGADFSGLENRTNAHLTSDKGLLHDLKNGICIHQRMASELYNIPYDEVDKATRDKTKPANFGDAYGQGPKSLHMATGLSLDWCKEFQKKKREIYPQTYLFYDIMLEVLNTKLKPSGSVTKYGTTLHCATWKNHFGYEMGFMENHSPYWLIGAMLKNKLGRAHPYIKQIKMAEEYDNRDLMYPIPENVKQYESGFVNMSPTKVKNYPNQNMASEMTMIASNLFLTKLLPYIRLKKILPISFIHDEYNFDCYDEEHAGILTGLIDQINDELVGYVKKEFDLELKIDFPMEYAVGDNWKEVH